jgi:AcrR family transcriptional regulator
MDAVAAKVGVTRGGLLYHFSKKQAGEFKRLISKFYRERLGLETTVVVTLAAYGLRFRIFSRCSLSPVINAGESLREIMDLSTGGKVVANIF